MAFTRKLSLTALFSCAKLSVAMPVPNFLMTLVWTIAFAMLLLAADYSLTRITRKRRLNSRGFEVLPPSHRSPRK